MDIQSSVGSAIRGTRTRLAMSQQELADRAGLHRTFISNLERGTCNISLTNLWKVATVLEISMSELFPTPDQFPITTKGGARSLSALPSMDPRVGPTALKA